MLLLAPQLPLRQRAGENQRTQSLRFFLDGIGNGLGYAWVLVAVGFVRELLGNGTLFGLRIIPECIYASNGGFYVNNGMMTMPAMALILLGCLIWAHRAINERETKKK